MVWARQRVLLGTLEGRKFCRSQGSDRLSLCTSRSQFHKTVHYLLTAVAATAATVAEFDKFVIGADVADQPQMPSCLRRRCLLLVDYLLD